MTVRRPLVIIAGQEQQLPVGDTVSGVSAASSESLTNGEAGAVVCGAPVYTDAAGSYKKGKANAVGTSLVIGLQQDASVASAGTGTIQNDGVLSLTTVQWDAVTGGSGGLTAGSMYWLDAATAGKLTTTAPTSTGQVVAPVGRALSTTDMLINIGTTILL